MGRAVLVDCLPWLALLMASVVCLRLLTRLGGSRLRLVRLWRLHRDEGGAAQSLSFVLVLPLFVMVMLFIVQVSQLMIGTVVVHYAAFAAARSAIVWIPAAVEAESENRVAEHGVDWDAPDLVFPVLDSTDPNYGPSEGGVTYLVQAGPKREKILSAALVACTAICPSREIVVGVPEHGFLAFDHLYQAYIALVPEAASDPAIARRLRNKLAYAMSATKIEIRFYHPNAEPPLVPYPELHEPIRPTDPPEFVLWQELGWQDPITVTVRHQMALLPGPGRLLARRVTSPDGSPDQVADSIGKHGTVYTYELTASATLGNEGEKSVIPYAHYIY